jgi:hypothetical protein
MTRWRRREVAVWTLATVAAAVAVTMLLVQGTVRHVAPDAGQIAFAAVLVALAAAVTRWPGRAPRFAWVYALPAAWAARQMLTGPPEGASYAIVAWVGSGDEAPPSTAAILASVADLPWRPSPDTFGVVAGVVLFVLLLSLGALGLVVLVRDARPGTGSVHVLAVVAAVLTVPIWAITSGWPQDADVAAPHLPWVIATARTAGLALSLVVSLAVIRARGRVPARAAAYFLPAVALTWAAQAGASRYALTDPGTPSPSWVTVLPGTLGDLALLTLVATTWLLAVRGARVALGRYRPPTALEEPLTP